MFMSVVDLDRSVEAYPELADARVLITGLTSSFGVDLARAFADRKSRLVVQAPETTPAMAELFALLSRSASEIKLYTDPLVSGDAATGFAQTAVRAYGCLDIVVNLVNVPFDDLSRDWSVDDIEDRLSDRLLPATLITRVTANRMRVTLTEGLVLNVVTMPEPRDAREAAFAAIARSALAVMTRREAQAWARAAIRINAVAPGTAAEDDPAAAQSESDIAALALYLASAKGRRLSGHVFDAAGMAARAC